MKTIDQYFADWESHVFGYGYGTGDEHTLKALQQFFRTVPDEGTYDYQKLEDALTPTIAWLLINVLAHADIIEYGTSPRFGWLTAEGKRLRAYLDTGTIDALIEATAGADDIRCYPDHCNCDDGPCENPFWRSVTP